MGKGGKNPENKKQRDEDETPGNLNFISFEVLRHLSLELVKREVKLIRNIHVPFRTPFASLTRSFEVDNYQQGWRKKKCKSLKFFMLMLPC